MKRRNGEYIAPFAPYGYIKDPEDRHALVVDPEAAEVVKLIFSLFLGGMRKSAIVLYLNERGVLSPSEYKRSKGMVYKTQLANGGKAMWGTRVINNILTHPLYTGDLVQGRRRVKSYKIHDIEDVPQED